MKTISGICLPLGYREMTKYVCFLVLETVMDREDLIKRLSFIMGVSPVRIHVKEYDAWLKRELFEASI